ncbi:MAG: VOC family protein [Pseudomonadales bacterium]|jgi:catechol 2,3-dioxygenase-like lactoylglutathione lyase family enzyme|nr:VOC family protein [Pseudomonadales bacterium]
MVMRLVPLLALALSSFAAAATPAASQASTVLAAEAVFHYEDLDRAARFYREQLGLVPVETREDAVVLEIAPGALLTLATLESGGHAPDAPRTAAIALVTDQLDEWWAALSTRGLNMRTKVYDPVPGRAHHGFVLVDPEGWFLEFERFNPHPENEQLLPRLDALPTRTVDAAAAGLPEGLGFKATILWFYYEDLAAAEDFVVETLGLPLITDQGWAKIHPLAPAAYLGLVDGARGMHAFTAEKAVRLDLIDADAQARARALRGKGVPVETIAEGVFEFGDPGAHRLRLRQPGGPEAHADYVVLGKSVNTRQHPSGELETLNTVFFAEIFETALGGVTRGVLEGPGDAAAGLPFPEGRIHFLAGERRPSIAELTEHYPDATYTFSFDTPSGRIDDLPVSFDAGEAGGRNPGPIRLTLRQEGRVVAADAVDAALDLEVEWTPFEKGAEDPLGIADDMIYVIFGNCLGEEIVHSGHAISDGEALTFRDTRFTIPAAALQPGEPFQLEVEHSEMDTGLERGIETIVTYAATTFLDLRTLGEASGERTCPAVPWAMDGGQTDRERPPAS